MNDYTNEINEYFNREIEVLNKINKQDLSNVMNLLEQARKEGRQIFVFGNGGSAATASHYCCDFNKGISLGMEKRYKMICLSDNVPTMMAYANDLSYDDVFLEPLKNFYKEGDVVLGISGSGNSRNVVKAIEWANGHNAVTIAFTGYSGGKMKQIAKFGVHIPIDDMQIAEDLHMLLDHCMMKILSCKA